MDVKECKTTSERDVIATYRKHLRRKGATPFSAQASALAEELHYGAVLSPAFVDLFTTGWRTIDDKGRVRLTPAGREFLEESAGLGRDLNEWHTWSPCGDYVRSGCGLIRPGLARATEEFPVGERMCTVCESVSTVETR